MAKKQVEKKSSGHGTEIGLALAGLAAIAGTVFLYGTDAGQKKRKQIKGWTLKAKGEVIEKLETLKEVNEENYHKVVDAVTAKYQKLKTVAPEELNEVVADLKKSWKHIVKIAKSSSAPKKAVKKPVKKVAK
jgi:hypothetical protein